MITSTKRSLMNEFTAVKRKKWSKTEERDLIWMCRHTDMSPDQIAVELDRSEESIRYRLAKIFLEHLDGRTDEDAVQDVSNWLLPN